MIYDFFAVDVPSMRAYLLRIEIRIRMLVASNMHAADERQPVA